jgi:hypothetical protein
MTESLKSTPGGEWLDGLEIAALGPAEPKERYYELRGWN